MIPPGKAGSFAGNAGILLYLSLFLLLLAFFIVLNAISVDNVHRARAVLKSVEQSFTIDPRLLFGRDPVASRAGTVLAVQRLNTLGDLFATAVAVDKVEVVAPGRHLEVRLPADGLFLPGTARLRPDRAGLLDRVAAALMQPLPGERIEAEFLVALSPDTPSQPPGPVDRAGALARDLVERGAPASAIGIGIERGAPGTARFVFSIRSAEETGR
ncbi:hypothetical protein [Azospirillum halopraeferens]|uniref:hypothetical protein n=1 Tax=Azospirillum halopraeferens TaxID=34010 RepID=UPI00041DE097|nr:hypothetical protein [Azospirillum halopraeferens]